jgi:hypothetical protein
VRRWCDDRRTPAARLLIGSVAGDEQAAAAVAAINRAARGSVRRWRSAAAASAPGFGRRPGR